MDCHRSGIRVRAYCLEMHMGLSPGIGWCMTSTRMVICNGQRSICAWPATDRLRKGCRMRAPRAACPECTGSADDGRRPRDGQVMVKRRPMLPSQQFRSGCDGPLAGKVLLSMMQNSRSLVRVFARIAWRRCVGLHRETCDRDPFSTRQQSGTSSVARSHRIVLREGSRSNAVVSRGKSRSISDLSPCARDEHPTKTLPPGSTQWRKGCASHPKAGYFR